MVVYSESISPRELLYRFFFMYLQHDVRKRWRFYGIHLVTYIRLHNPGYGNHLPLWPFLLLLNTFHDKRMVYDGRESEEICLCLSLLSAAVFLFGRMLHWQWMGSCHGSGSWWPVSDRRGLSLMQGHFMWYLWWKTRHWDTFSSR